METSVRLQMGVMENFYQATRGAFLTVLYVLTKNKNKIPKFEPKSKKEKPMIPCGKDTTEFTKNEHVSERYLRGTPLHHNHPNYVKPKH